MMSILTAAVLFSSSAALPEVTSQEDDSAREIRNWSASLQFAPTIMSVGPLGLFVPSAGIQLEMRLGDRWGVQLGLNGILSQTAESFGGSFKTASTGGRVEPGLRYYLNRTFSGPWLGLSVPLGLSVQKSVYASVTEATDGSGVGTEQTTRSEGTARYIGVTALAGWSFEWQRRFFASVAAGPSVQWWQSNSTIPTFYGLSGGGLSSLTATGKSSSGASLALQAQMSFGVLF